MGGQVSDDLPPRIGKRKTTVEGTLKKFTVLKQFTFGTTKDTHRLHKHGEVIETNFPPKIEADLVKGGFITPYREPEAEPEKPKGDLE